MKNFVITILFSALVVSCKKPQQSATELDKASGTEVDLIQPQPKESTSPKSLKNPTIRHEGKEYSLKEWNELKEKEDAKSRAAWEASKAQLEEFERIQNLPPFEAALEPNGNKAIASAFIVRIDAYKKPTLGRVIYGKAPTDYVMYLGSIEASRSYLVGAVMPRSGYKIHYDREEYRYCILLTKNEKFTVGGESTESRNIEELEQSLRN